jgi:hypothetical protein
MKSRWCLRLVLLASLATMLAVFAGVGRNAAGRSLRFELNALVIPEVMQSGMEYDFDAVVVNESSQPARVIGAGDYCAESCYSGQGLPVAVPARGRRRVTVHIKAGVPGDFSGDLTFYTDRPSQPTLTIKLAGTVRNAQPFDGPSHATNP